MELHFNLLLVTHLHLNDPERKKKKRTTLGTLSSRGQEQSSPLRKEAKQSVFHTEREREREGVSEVGKLGEMERGSEREEEAERMRINTELARGSREQPGLSQGPLACSPASVLSCVFGNGMLNHTWLAPALPRS